MISPSEMNTLLKRLDENTQKGTIEWFQVDSNSYRCSFPKSSVVTFINQGRGNYGLLVLNSSGEEVGRLVADSSTTPTQDQLLEQIFSSAERQALSIDETLEDILSNLD